MIEQKIVRYLAVWINKTSVVEATDWYKSDKKHAILSSVKLTHTSVFQDEAFALWQQQWARIYPEGSKSREIINTIHDSYLLVNLVDNDYVAGNCLFEAIKHTIKLLDEKEQSAESTVAEAKSS